MSSYKNKMLQCKERMISFEFSEKEWDAFQDLKLKVNCAYTKRSFVHKENHSHQPSLERIDDLKGYSVENCIWVTREANMIKDAIKTGSVDKLTSHQKGYATRIERILNNVEFLQEIQAPYLAIKQKEANIVTEVKNTKQNNPELAIAKLYAQFGTDIEQKTDLEFNLTYNQFKSLVSRKRCSLTNRVLPDSVFQLGFFIPNKTLPVTKENCFVTTKDVQNALDIMTTSCKLTSIELKLLCKTLSK